MTEPLLGKAPAVCFVASIAFIDALDRAAAQQGQTRSHYARNLLAQHLRNGGLLPSDGALTNHDARRYRGRRRATGTAS